MKLFKLKKTISVWGSPEPKQLLDIFAYLNRHGFLGPSDTSSLYSFNFFYPINDDLEIWCSVNRVGSNPEGSVFYLSTSFGLQSKSLLRICRDAKLHQEEIPDPNQYAESIFSIELAHLKWNAEPGDENPVWRVSQLPEFQHAASDWIRDWEKYAAPTINAIADLSSAIDFCLKIRRYQKNSWVKSDGYRCAALEQYLAILMAENNQASAAKELLREALVERTNQSTQAELRLVLSWIESQSNSSSV